MLEGKEEVIKLPAMPRKPMPPACNYYLDCGNKEKPMSESLKEFKNLPAEKKEPYILKFKKSYEKYKKDLEDWSVAAEKAGYVENVQYQSKDIVAALDKFHINVDVKSCSELLGKLAGHWVVQTLKQAMAGYKEDDKLPKYFNGFLRENKLLKDSDYFVDSLNCFNRVKPTDYIKEANEIDDIGTKIRTEGAAEKSKVTKQMNKDYKSNKLGAILKE